MHVSLFEIWKITQRCLEAAGVPAGHDREGAFATMWLAEHGFPSMDIVSEADLSRGADWALNLTRTGGDTKLDAAGLPLISLAIDAVDLIVADAHITEESEPTQLTITKACAPLYLLPFAARRAQLSGSFTICWHSATSEVSITVAGGDVWIDGGALDELNDVTSTCDVVLSYNPNASLDTTPAGLLLTPEQISDRRNVRLSVGIEVDQAKWVRMVEMSRAVLVPDSVESRARGAGGGNAND